MGGRSCPLSKDKGAARLKKTVRGRFVNGPAVLTAKPPTSFRNAAASRFASTLSIKFTMSNGNNLSILQMRSNQGYHDPAPWNWPWWKGIIVNTPRGLLTKSPSARFVVLTSSATRLMVMLRSSKAIVPQMKIAFTGLTRKAAAASSGAVRAVA